MNCLGRRAIGFTFRLYVAQSLKICAALADRRQYNGHQSQRGRHKHIMLLKRTAFQFLLVLFLLCAAVLLGRSLILIKTSADTSQFRVGFPYKTILSEFDPARVQVAAQYALLENLYLPLLQKDNEGRLIPGAASKFYWVDDEIEFIINEDLHDSGGQKITADDAYFSLMRLLVLGTSTHGDLKKLICADHQPQSVNDQCVGIRIVDGKLRLRPGKKNFAIFENFSSIDFAVIPRRSVDPNDLRSIDLSITSGVYSIQERRDDGALVLRANPEHFLYSARIPQNPIFVPTGGDGRTGAELFEKNEIDFLNPLDQGDLSERIDRYRSSEKASIFQTLPVRLELLVFTAKGMRLSSEQRWAIGNALANHLATQYEGKSGYQSTYQYFPEGGKGSLSPQDLETIVTARQAISLKTEDGAGLVMGAFARNYDRLRSLATAILPKLEVARMAKLPAYDPDIDAPEYPHFYIVLMDTGFLEALPNVVNSIKSGFLGITNQEREAWLDEYLANADEDQRVSSLRKLHLESLLAPVVIPIIRMPYVSVVRKPWQLNFSFLFPNSPLWKISTN